MLHEHIHFRTFRYFNTLSHRDDKNPPVELLTPASVHQSGGDGGGGDAALPQVRLLLDGRELMGSVTLRAALLERRHAAAAIVVVVVVERRAGGGEAELFRRRGRLTQGQRQAAGGGLLLSAAHRSE